MHGKQFTSSFKIAKCIESRFSIGLYSLVISLLCSTEASSQGVKGSPVRSIDSEAYWRYVGHYASEVLKSTPRVSIKRFPDAYDDVEITAAEVNYKGNWESFYVQKVSRFQKQDFWTIWAVATCPPINPGNYCIKFPTYALVRNSGMPGEQTADEEECRKSLGGVVEGLKSDGEIVFPLIPVSIAWIYPNTCSKKELLSINNLVEIPASILPPKEKWSTASANEWINSGPLKEFLREWHKFYIAKEKPSRAEILSFAQLLKKKYQKDCM
jgi:hypothetical protein